MKNSTMRLLLLSAPLLSLTACGGKSGQALSAEKQKDITEERQADRPIEIHGQTLAPLYTMECTILNSNDSEASAAELGCNVIEYDKKAGLSRLFSGPIAEPDGQIVTKSGQVLDTGPISINLSSDYRLSFAVQGVSPQDVEDVQLTVRINGENQAMVHRPQPIEPL